MKYRSLGKTGVEVSEIGHGTWAMGFMWGERKDPEAKAALRRGMELGINFIDTAYLYGQGHSERLIGEMMREMGQRPFIATKIPPNIKDWPPKPGTPAQQAFSGEYLIEITERSLKNLGVDSIDLQQLHVWRPEWLGQGDWLDAVEKLKSQGKIRFFGVSLNDHDADSGLEVVASGLIDSVQVIFNLFEQRPRENLFPACLKHGVGVIARVPLDEGGLSGSLQVGMKFPKGDWRSHYFKGDRIQETLKHAEQFVFLIEGPIRSLPEAALKFCLSEPAVSTVIPGMRTVRHVEANAVVSEFPDFNAAALSRAHQLAWPRNFYPTAW
jgi:aryl-alcohol dehydrogenase-like predicted oxidoreductase